MSTNATGTVFSVKRFKPTSRRIDLLKSLIDICNAPFLVRAPIENGKVPVNVLPLTVERHKCPLLNPTGLCFCAAFVCRGCNCTFWCLFPSSQLVVCCTWYQRRLFSFDKFNVSDSRLPCSPRALQVELDHSQRRHLHCRQSSAPSTSLPTLPSTQRTLTA